MKANNPQPVPLQLLGPPVYADGAGAPVVFLPERKFALLAYLACRRNWVTRDELADLFWSERSQAAARSNLRKVLLLVQKIGGLPPLEQQGDRLRWMPDSDLQRFDAACAERRHVEALALYRGRLLQGLDAGLPAGAEAWLSFERERITSRWREAATQHLAELSAEPAAAAALAEEMLQHDPFDEAALLALGQACGALEQPARGLQALQTHRKRLAAEYGLEPPATLRDLAERLRGLRAMPVTQGDTHRPAAAAPPIAMPGFVGRRIELGQLQQLLMQPACRVLTVTGPGGIGKSSLARAAIGTTTFDTSAWWVALDDLSDVTQLPGRVASVIDLDLQGGNDPWRQIEAFIGHRHALLVFDNSEHLIGLAGIVAALLAVCANLKLLNTSRNRLSLDGEWLLPLDGLPLPDADETEPDVLRHNDAVRLFEARARAAAPAFDLAAQAADVVGLVHAIEGLPLAIELAAAWVRLLPVRDIVAELAGSLDLLDAHARAGDARSARDRSLRASFEHSWGMLTPSERDGLTQLAQLPGPFAREMAQQVASSPLPVLAALIDKSLLRVDVGSGRFSLHPLVRQCAAEKAAMVDVVMVLARHVAYMGHWLARFGEPRRLAPGEVLNEIERELPHVRAAWSQAIERRDVSAVMSMTHGLAYFYEQRGLWVEGLAALAQATSAFASGVHGHDRVLVTTLRELATLQYRSGQLVEAESSARRALKIARRLGDGRAVKSGLNTLGLSLWQRGRFVEARPFFEQARRRAVKDGDDEGVARFSGNLALVDKALGHYQRALAGYQNALGVHRATGAVTSIVSMLNNIANVYRALQCPQDALPALNEALELCSTHSLVSTKAFVLVNLGLVSVDLGEHAAAAVWFSRALSEAREHGEPIIEAATLLAQGHLDVIGGKGSEACRKVWDALAIGDRLHSPAVQIQCVFGFGEILVSQGRVETGATLLQWGIEQEGLNRADRDAAQRKLDALDMSAEALARCRATLPASASLQDALALAPALG